MRIRTVAQSVSVFALSCLIGAGAIFIGAAFLGYELRREPCFVIEVRDDLPDLCKPGEWYGCCSECGE